MLIWTRKSKLLDIQNFDGNIQSKLEYACARAHTSGYTGFLMPCARAERWKMLFLKISLSWYLKQSISSSLEQLNSGEKSAFSFAACGNRVVCVWRTPGVICSKPSLETGAEVELIKPPQSSGGRGVLSNTASAALGGKGGAQHLLDPPVVETRVAIHDLDLQVQPNGIYPSKWH